MDELVFFVEHESKNVAKHVPLRGRETTDFLILGMEIASYLVSKARSVAVVGSGRTKVPFEKLLGEKVGKMYVKVSNYYSWQRTFLKVNISITFPVINNVD